MKYFTIQELTASETARQLGIDNTPPPATIVALTMLTEQVLDPLREAWGSPIKVNSGYRCKRLNTAVHGAPCSQHLRGEAADITVGAPASNRLLLKLLRQLNLPVDQVIDEHGCQWLHVSHTSRRANRCQWLTR